MNIINTIEKEIEAEVEAGCICCRGKILFRSVGVDVKCGVTDIELTPGMKEREYYRLFRTNQAGRLLACSKCSWARSV